MLFLILFFHGDHAFNVLGLSLTAKPACPSSWGPDAVIVDAWIGEVYSASELGTRLKNYSQVTSGDKVSYFLESYNPNYHRLGSP
jgi:hypothetical protein